MMESIKNFIIRYRGALIGALIAIIVLVLQVYKFIIGVLIIAFGIFLGNYIQYNKEIVKEKLKFFIDRL